MNKVKKNKKDKEDLSDIWNLDATISKFIIEKIKKFKIHNCGYPSNLTVKKWNDILDKMIHAFELVYLESNDGTILSNKDIKHMKEGLRLFSKYFRDLWY